MWKHKDSTVYSFTRGDDLEMLARVKEISDGLGHENYSNLDWHAFDAVSVYLREDTIYGFSSIWHRPEYYAPGEIRILNRYWEQPEFRRISKVIGGNHLVTMVKQQMQIARSLDYTTCFISREKSPRYFGQLINTIATETNTHWDLSPDRVPVCNPEAESCWQFKGSTKLC